MVEGESQHVHRTLRALELLARAPRSQAELALELGVHPRTVRRLLQRLETDGYAVRSASQRGRFTLTLKLVALAGHILAKTDIIRIAAPHVTALADRTGEDAHLSIPGEAGVIHVIQSQGGNLVIGNQSFGQQLAYHSTAVGKALLAHLPSRVQHTLSATLERFTENTITEASDLLLALAMIRERGHATALNEDAYDVASAAAPVFDHTGELVAALGISTSADRDLDELGTIARAEAQDLSAALGYSGVPRPPRTDRSRLLPPYAVRTPLERRSIEGER